MAVSARTRRRRREERLHGRVARRYGCEVLVVNEDACVARPGDGGEKFLFSQLVAAYEDVGTFPTAPFVADRLDARALGVVLRWKVKARVPVRAV